MIRKILKYAGIAILGLLALVFSSALLCREYLRHKVGEERAIRSPNGIDSLERARIGGMDQWVEVRGQNVDNPVLLFIHGGPGIAASEIVHDPAWPTVTPRMLLSHSSGLLNFA